MHAGREPLGRGYALEQADELIALRLVERGEQLCLVRIDRPLASASSCAAARVRWSAYARRSRGSRRRSTSPRASRSSTSATIAVRCTPSAPLSAC